MKILLIWPNSRNEVLGWGDLGAVAEPLALEYLAAGVQEDGHQVVILDLRLHAADLERVLREFAPDIVGVTAYSMHVLTALSICQRIKALRPATWTVVGGHHATLLPEDFFEPPVDFVVCGEGVAPLRTLLRALEDGTPATAIPGLWTQQDGRFQSGGDPANFTIDALPLPDRSTTRHDRGSFFIDWMKPVALVRTTVGCPYRCSFCSLWKIMEGRYHQRDINRVVEEIGTLDEDFVFLVDDEAFVNQPRMQRLAEALHARRLHKRYFAYCRIDTLLRGGDVLTAWRNIGLERLFIGIDAITEKNLHEYNKRLKLAQIEAGFKAAQELGIEIFAQFVVNTDYTKSDFKQLVRFIEHHKIRYPSFTVLTPIPGTAMLENFDSVIECQANGRPNWDLFDCQNAVTRTRLPKEEFRREYRNLYRVFKGSYAQYREHNFLMNAAAHDGDVGALSQGCPS